MNSKKSPVLIGLGSNLSGKFGSPRGACGAALEALQNIGLKVIVRSPWYESVPVPISEQPHFVNGIVSIMTELAPAALLRQILKIERIMGRQRTKPNAARIIDLDLLAHGELICDGVGGFPVLPHPRLHERAFVILPLADLMPDWQHPLSRYTALEMKTNLGTVQEISRMVDANGLYGTEWRE